MVTTYDKVLDTCYEVTTTVCAIMMVPVLVVVRLLASAPGESEPKAQLESDNIVGPLEIWYSDGKVIIKFDDCVPGDISELVVNASALSSDACLCAGPCVCDHDDYDEYHDNTERLLTSLRNLMRRCASESDLCKCVRNEMIRDYGLCSVLGFKTDDDGVTSFVDYELLNTIDYLAFAMVRSGRVRAGSDVVDCMHAMRECYGDWMKPPHDEIKPLVALVSGLVMGFLYRAKIGDIDVGETTWRPHKHVSSCEGCPFIWQ